jgi:hypothetical protein
VAGWKDPICEEAPVPGNDDIKAKMAEALKKKQRKDKGVDVDESGHRIEKAPETHGPLGGVHMHRRKAGGGGS